MKEPTPIKVLSFTERALQAKLHCTGQACTVINSITIGRYYVLINENKESTFLKKWGGGQRKKNTKIHDKVRTCRKGDHKKARVVASESLNCNYPQKLEPIPDGYTDQYIYIYIYINNPDKRKGVETIKSI